MKATVIDSYRIITGWFDINQYLPYFLYPTVTHAIIDSSVSFLLSILNETNELRGTVASTVSIDET